MRITSHIMHVEKVCREYFFPNNSGEYKIFFIIYHAGTHPVSKMRFELDQSHIPCLLGRSFRVNTAGNSK